MHNASLPSTSHASPAPARPRPSLAVIPPHNCHFRKPVTCRTLRTTTSVCTAKTRLRSPTRSATCWRIGKDWSRWERTLDQWGVRTPPWTSRGLWCPPCCRARRSSTSPPRPPLPPPLLPPPPPPPRLHRIPFETNIRPGWDGSEVREKERVKCGRA